MLWSRFCSEFQIYISCKMHLSLTISWWLFMRYRFSAKGNCFICKPVDLYVTKTTKWSRVVTVSHTVWTVLPWKPDIYSAGDAEIVFITENIQSVTSVSLWFGHKLSDFLHYETESDLNPLQYNIMFKYMKFKQLYCAAALISKINITHGFIWSLLVVTPTRQSFDSLFSNFSRSHWLFVAKPSLRYSMLHCSDNKQQRLAVKTSNNSSLMHKRCWFFYTTSPD